MNLMYHGGMNSEDKQLYDAALLHHNYNVELLHGVLQRGASESSNDAWSKTCSFLLKGYLHALSPTPAPSKVAEGLGHPGKLAYFGLTKPVPEKYALDDLISHPGIQLLNPPSSQSGVGAFEESIGMRNPNTGAIAVVDPLAHSNPVAYAEAAIKQLLPTAKESSEAPSTSNERITG